LALLPGRIGSTRVSLLTVTVEEFDGVSQIFGLRHNLPGTGYFVREAVANNTYDVVLRRLAGQTNTVAMEGAGAVIEDFRPEFLILIGTCGGHGERDGVALGDVIVADYIDYSGYWKYKGGKRGRILLRKTPHDHPSGYLLQNFVEPLRVSEEWIPRVRGNRPQAGQPKLRVGGIVSGDILLGDPANKEQRRILDFFDKAYGFEMEAYGIARAVYNARRFVRYNPQFLVVRGVSDLVNEDPQENQAVRQAWTPYAIETAGTFALAIIEKLLTVEVSGELVE
jgi:nucleoside phosphorylase